MRPTSISLVRPRRLLLFITGAMSRMTSCSCSNTVSSPQQPTCVAAVPVPAHCEAALSRVLHSCRRVEHGLLPLEDPGSSVWQKVRPCYLTWASWTGILR